MQLAYISPVSLETLIPFMIVEVILIFVNVFLFAFFLYMLLKIRIHINLRIIIFIGVAQYFPSLLLRLVTIAYQMKLLQITDTPETTAWLIICSFFRYYHFGICLSFPMFLALERQLAMVFIHDYERKKRLWIAVIIPIGYTTYSATFVGAYIYDIFNWQITIIPALVLGMLGSVLFMKIDQKVRKLLKELEKAGSQCQIDYSLSLRYQLQENLWSCKLLQNGILSMSLINTTGLITYVAAYLGREAYFLSNNAAQIMDCLFNLCVVVNGPILGAGIVIFNDYLKKLVTSTLVSSVVPNKGTDEGQLYFSQLQQQWKF